MKVLSLVIAVALASTALAGIKPGDGLPSADVKMKGVDGKEVSLAGIQGTKGTLVIFTCLQCPFAKAWDARIAKLANACRQQGIGAAILNPNNPAVAGDTFEAMQKHAQKASYEIPYLVDEGSTLARAFGASRTPECYVFDKAGKLVYHGAVDDNKDAGSAKQPYLKDALDAVAAGKEPPVKETKAVGCSIKFYKK